ncbi:MAG: hypothetical protein MJZ20_14935 [Bacteroidaceae bacterium]|nr:hypothetical protein [Bacteroidaceae bacterium]
MDKYSEKHFCIDAGDGEKMDGCPYSLYEDGHDVQDYIIPPKGFKFTGFKCVMLPENRIYDGKLIAQYEKEPLSNRIQSNLKYIILGAAALVIIIVLIALVAKPSGSKEKANKKQDVVEVVETPETVEVPETTEIETVDSDSINVIENTPEVAPVEEPVTQTPDEMFKQEFWGLIHQKTLQMDPYTDLYNKYKSEGVSGEEFEYLRLTILKDWSTYKEWYPKLKRIPDSDLTSINTVNDLITKLNE